MSARHLPTAVVLLGLAAGFTHAAVTVPDRPARVTVEIFEDGSGIEWRDGRKVRTFDEGTFPWDCETDGNRRCGMPGETRP